MKNILLSMLVVAFCLPAMGQMRDNKKFNRTTGKSSSFKDIRKQLKGFSMVGYWSLADRLPVKVGSQVVNAKSESAFGLGAQYKYDMSRYSKNKTPISVIGGMVYESSRNIRSFNNNGQINEISNVSDPSFSMVLLYANVDWRFNESASVFGGLNMPLPFESDFGEVSLSGTPGFQGGLTLDVAQSFQTDLAYRWINLKGNNGLNRIDVDGLVLQGRYIF